MVNVHRTIWTLRLEGDNILNLYGSNAKQKGVESGWDGLSPMDTDRILKYAIILLDSYPNCS